MKNVLFVFPTTWDHRQLEACRGSWQDRYRVEFTTPTDEDCSADLDILEFIDRQIRRTRPLDGVTSSSDYPGAVVAAAVATGLGLPGPRPESVLRCSHKYYARLAELGPVPECVPAFALVDPETPSQPLHWVVPRGRTGGAAPSFPCFVKPTKGAFSVMSSRVEDAASLETFLSRPCVREYTCSYLRIFEQLLGRYADWEHGSRFFLAEELLRGEQVTIEGFVVDGEVEILGVVDSEMYPGTRSFARFVYPSRLPDDIKSRMAAVVRRVVPRLGLDRTLFNIEMMYDTTSGRVWILEVNPRMCGQFADLYEKVDGTNGYVIALQVAAGERPVLTQGAGPHPVAASFALRVFEPGHVRRAPSRDDVRAAESLFPGTLVWLEYEAGESLCDFESVEDGSSARYAVVNLGAPDRDSLEARCEAVQSRLRFEVESAVPAPAGAPAVSTPS